MTKPTSKRPATKNPAPQPRGASAAPAEPADEPIVAHGHAIYAINGAKLPSRCVACGDSLELAAFRTVPGRVRYWVCREHRIEAYAKLAVGLAMIGIALWQLASPLLDGGRPTRTTAMFFVPILFAGLALALFAIPVHAGRLRGGRRRLYGAGRVVRRGADEE